MPSAQLVYRSRAVRALVLLHEEHLRRFLVVWKQARAASVALPQTDDPAYASLDSLLHHVLRAARGYMTWMCEVLALPDPEIRMAPDPAVISQDAEGHMEHVLERWQTPLQDVGDDRLETPEYPSRWHRRDAGTCGHAPHSACVPTRRANGQPESQLTVVRTSD